MKKQWTTVLDFIQNGKVSSKYKIVNVEGMNQVGDGGQLTLVRTGNVGTPSQSFLDTGNNTCIDKNGDVWEVQKGDIVYFNGSDDWFGNGFGSIGEGGYLYDPDGSGWNLVNGLTSGSLGGLSGYQASNLTDLTNGLTIGGDIVEHRIGQVWMVNTESPMTFVITDTNDGDYTTLPAGDFYAQYVGGSNVNSIIKSYENATEYTGNLPSASFRGRLDKLIPRMVGVKITREGDNFIGKASYRDIIGSGDVRIFISSYGSGSDDGLSPRSPKTFSQFSSEASNGDYNDAGSLYLYLMDDVYYWDDAIVNFGVITGTRIYIESVSPSGDSWLTTSPKLSWVQNGNYFSANYTNDWNIGAVCNLIEKDGLGLPIPYEKVNSIPELRQGSFYVDEASTTVYVRPFNVRTGIEVGLLANYGSSSRFNFTGHTKAIFLNRVNLFTRGLNLEPNTQDLQVFTNCKFVNGANDCLAVVANKYTVLLIDCIGAWSGKDVFNYHHDTSNSEDDCIAVEVNCKGYNAGVYKHTGYPDANTTTNSNNGSTSHDGTTIWRFGCDYWNCQGSVVADVGGCKSINYGLKSGDVADGSEGVTPLFFSGSDSGSPSYTVLVDCDSYGRDNVEISALVYTSTLVYDELIADPKTLSFGSALTTVEFMK